MSDLSVIDGVGFRAAAVEVVKDSEFDVDALEQQLRQELASRNASIPGPTMVGCFAQKP
jgi:hypothetical protein